MSVSGVKNAEPIRSGLDFQVGGDFAIYQEHVAEDFRYPGCLGIRGYWINQLAVAIKLTITNDQTNLMLTAWKPQTFFKFVPIKNNPNNPA